MINQSAEFFSYSNFKKLKNATLPFGYEAQMRPFETRSIKGILTHFDDLCLIFLALYGHKIDNISLSSEMFSANQVIFFNYFVACPANILRFHI
jgi:hypothetical protein